jgi:HTH-type transcriptional regulator, competence development regulator
MLLLSRGGAVSRKLNKAFGAALRDVRKKHNLSQLKISSRSGVDRTYMSDLEQGKKGPSLETVIRLAKAIGISPAELVKKTMDIMG